MNRAKRRARSLLRGGSVGVLVLCLVVASATVGVTGVAAAPSDDDQFDDDDWPTYQSDAGRTGHHPNATAPQGNVSVAWNHTRSGGSDYSPAVVYDGSVFYTNATTMFARNATTGALEWSWTGANSSVYWYFQETSPVVLNGRVFAVTGRAILGFDAATGSLEAVHEGIYPQTDGYTPVASDDHVFYTLDDDGPMGDTETDGRVYAITADGTEVWNRSLAHWPTGPVAYANGTVFVENIWRVTAFNTTSGNEVWDTFLGEYVGVVTVVDDRVYASVSDDYTASDPNDYVYALNATTGETVWRFNVSAQIGDDYANPSSTVVTDGETIFVGDNRENLYALDATDGSVNWTRAYDGIGDLDDFLLVDGTLYAQTGSTLRALDATSGDFLWNYTVAGPITAVAVSEGRLYVTHDDGITVLEEGVHYSDLAVSDTDLGIGDSATVSATVSNPQSSERSYTATLFSNGAVVDRQTGTLAAGDSTTVSFTPAFSAPKNYSVAIGNHPSQSDDAPIVVSVWPQSTGTWPSLRGNPRGTGVVDVSPPVDDLSVLWSTETDAYDYDFTSPVAADGIVYFTGIDADYESGGLAAYDAATGEEYWHVGEELYSTPTVHNGTVFASVYSTSGNDVIYAMDASPVKDRKWSVNLGDNTYYQGSLTVVNGTVYVPTDSAATLVALDEDDGSVKWMATVSDSIYTTPAVAGDLVYFGDDDGYVYAYDTATGDEVWSTDSLGFDVTSPAVADGTVYVTVDYELYALDAETGAVEWNRSVPDPEESAPVVVDGLVIHGSTGTDGGVYAYDTATGVEQWNYTLPGSDFRIPAVATDVVYVVDQYETLYGFDATTGTMLFNATGFEPEETPAIVDNYLYVYGDTTDYSLVALQGTTSTAPAAGSVDVAGPGAFGDVPVGSTATGDVTVTNDGDGVLDVSGTAVTGTDAGAFAVTDGAAPFTLAPGDAQTVTVSFAPTTTGAHAATLEVASNDSTTPQVDVPLDGTGVNPLAANDTTVDFGPVAVTETGAAAVLVTNVGDGSVEVDAATLAGADPSTFSVDTPVPFSLAPGESRAVQMAFTPSTEGAAAATLTLGTTDPDLPALDVTLSGEGVVPDVDVNPTELAFENQAVDGTTTRTVDVTNVGSAPLAVSTVDVSGTAFAVTPAGGFTLAAGQTQALDVTFSPDASGAYDESLTVASDDPDEPTVTVTLSGTGATDAGSGSSDSSGGSDASSGGATATPTGTPSISVNSLSLSPNPLTAGETATLTASLRNDGDATGQLDVRLLVDGAAVGATQVVELDPGEERTVTVTRQFDVPGEYTLELGGATAGSLQVLAPDPTPTASDGADGPGSDSGGEAVDDSDNGTTTATGAPGSPTSVQTGQPGFGLSVTLVALLGVGLLAARRRKP